MSPAFYETFGQRLASWIEFTGIRLERGDADLGALGQAFERDGKADAVGIYQGTRLEAREQSIHLCSRRWGYSPRCVTLTALLLVGQALARQTTLGSSGDHPLLRSLGMTGP